MPPILPVEVILAIASYASQGSLAALSRVSKQFYAICLPILYQRVIIDCCTVEKWRYMLSSLRKLGGTQTENYHVNFLIDRCNCNDPQELLQLLAVSLQQMPRLRSFKICGYWVGALDKAIANQKTNILDQLQEFKNLEEVIICHHPNPFYKFIWKLPKFKNLRSLALHRMAERDIPDYLADIAEVLLASPGLKHFGFSFNLEAGFHNFLFLMICHFHLQREGRLLPLLQLESLHLGIGAMPWANFYGATNYLDNLTDLTYLTTLRLDNKHYLEHEVDLVPFREISPLLFERAVNLRRISVERYSLDISNLIQLIRGAQWPLKLDALDVLEYARTLKPREERSYETEYYNPGEPVYSLPINQSGCLWRRLCYSGPFASDNSPESLSESNDILRNFVAKCTALEELILPIHNRRELDILKEEVLPYIPHLHTLHIPWGYLEDLHSDLEPIWHSPYQLRHMNEEEKNTLFREIQENNRKHEKARISIVRELFEWHQELRLKKPDIVRLRYIAINCDAYTCQFTSQDDSYILQDGSSIVRLSHEEAKEVGIVGTLHDSWTFELL